VRPITRLATQVGLGGKSAEAIQRPFVPNRRRGSSPRKKDSALEAPASPCTRLGGRRAEAIHVASLTGQRSSYLDVHSAPDESVSARQPSSSRNGSKISGAALTTADISVTFAR